MTTDNICFHLQNRLIQTSETGGQWYNDTSPFSIPWAMLLLSPSSQCFLKTSVCLLVYGLAPVIEILK
jgi:hypothetical protein